MHRKGEESKEEADFADRDFLKGKDLSNQTAYHRPSLPEGFADWKDDIEFMQIDCDYYTTPGK